MTALTLTFEMAQYLFTDDNGRSLDLRVVACDNGTIKFFLYIDNAIAFECDKNKLTGMGASTLTEILDTHWVPIVVSQMLELSEKKN